MGMLGDGTDDEKMAGVLQTRVYFFCSAGILCGLRFLVYVIVGANLFLL